jgi:hypothetical protein
MDQVKKFLKIAVANRFWILCVVAALMPMIAFFVGKGKLVTETAAKASDIKSANDGLTPYKSGKLPNPEWKSLAEAKTAKLTEEINVAWKKLYDKQAPLLKWPLDRVEEKFRAWGRKHPDAMEASPDDVQLVIQDYINFHPEYVTTIYKSFRPFDFESGQGIVVSPAEAALLRPDKFEISSIPKLNAIWKEQEKLWVSQAVLDVVNQVNKSAETWDTAPIKQIILLEVASETALDPMSKTKGVELVDPPTILAPGEEEGGEEDAGGEGGMMDMMSAYGAPGGAGGKGGMMGMEGDMMGGPGGMGGMMGGGAGGTKTAPDVVKFLAAPEGVENPPYFIVPILLTTLIEQDKVADLLVELENSPMAIQVMSLELAKPSIKVQKPEKGNSTMLGYGGMTGMMGGRGGMGMGSMEDMMGGYGMMGGPGGMMGGRGGMGMEGMMGGPGGMMDMMGGMSGMGGTEVRKGTDVRSRDRRKEREEAGKDLAKRARMSLQDPYYNVVELSVYGQARFYTPPPAPEATMSEGDAATTEPSTEATPEAPTTEPSAEAAPESTETPKSEEAKPEESNS